MRNHIIMSWAAAAAAGIGLLFGTIPARKAAQANPVDSLRAEWNLHPKGTFRDGFSLPWGLRRQKAREFLRCRSTRKRSTA